MRVLVAAACIAIIIGVTYFVSSEFVSYRIAHDADIKKALADTLRVACLDDLQSVLPNKTKIRNCLDMGALGEVDVVRREQQIGMILH
ncbi:conserved hypothetical protein [Mesorhizobium plurifarium]|uniref:Uncharacterized protein n=1 Tax=Mesorhizobium plurifarium TaxID=69974 RepID=A0A090EFK0_MESPL|nr:conserved hypothetical protein [Mesorhizobium plurifarium]